MWFRDKSSFLICLQHNLLIFQQNLISKMSRYFSVWKQWNRISSWKWLCKLEQTALWLDTGFWCWQKKTTQITMHTIDHFCFREACSLAWAMTTAFANWTTPLNESRKYKSGFNQLKIMYLASMCARAHLCENKLQKRASEAHKLNQSVQNH